MTKVKRNINKTLPPIAILGAGSWGTALALRLAQHEQTVQLWEFEANQVAAMQRDRSNSKYLPGIDFPDNLTVFGDLKKTLEGAQDILIVVPSDAFVSTLQSLKPYVTKQHRIIWATKGIDPVSCRLFHELVIEILGERPMAVLSGPSFAKEVAADLPTVVVIASNSDELNETLVSRFNRGHFRVYKSKDLIGVQLGGAIKNVIALAAGVSDGLGFGANARAGLITRGLAEMMRLGLAMGAKRETFMGLSGVGDLVLTCTDNQSRNRRFGLAIAQGMSREDAEKSIGQVVEGIHTAHQVIELAKKYHVEMPICEQVWRVLQDEVEPKEAVVSLLSRDPKAEN